MTGPKALSWNRTISADEVEPLVITCCATDGLFGGDTSLPACPDTPEEIGAATGTLLGAGDVVEIDIAPIPVPRNVVAPASSNLLSRAL